MQHKHKLIVIIGLASSFLVIVFIFLIWVCRKRPAESLPNDLENSFESKAREEGETEDLIIFEGGEDLTAYDLLEAPGEVIGKSSYGTLYRASLLGTDANALLRFLRPTCTRTMAEVVPMIQLLGSIRHPNLVPLYAFYAGPRGEKLMVHPFYGRGNLTQFIRDGSGESHKWAVIYRISIGIARGLDCLHTGFSKPTFHGNLKSKNVFLGRNYQPHISDFGLQLLLNPAASQEMLEASAAQGYKAPELIKMKEGSEETDIFSFGVILLELLTGMEPIDKNPTPDQNFYLPNFLRNAILDHRTTDLYHPSILLGLNSDQRQITKERILKLFQLAMACCSPSPALRPNTGQILRRLEEIGE